MIHRLLFFLVTICSAPAGFAASNEARQAALSSISADELQAHVDALADDMFEGRKAGSRGGRAAGTYLVTRFEKHGLQPAGDEGSFFQTLQSGYRNILAVMPGSDPELKDQFILIGAHYDHVGYGSPRTSYGPLGYIHNGADDNASGTAAVLELIEAFSMVPQLPRRSIVFALWDGEEQGLKGSKHWVANPTVSLSKICTVINCDMIGRLGEKGLKIYGTRSAQGLRKLISHNNRHIGLSIDFTWEMKANSDHWPFFQQNIPVLMFHTGLHDDYHRPSDDAEKVNKDGMQQIARLLFNVGLDLADRDQPPKFRQQTRQESLAEQKEFEQKLPSYPPRFGVWWDLSDRVSPGVGIKNIVQDSAADRAGVQAGDRVIQFAGRKVTSREQLTKDLLWAEAPVEVVLKRPGVEELVTVEVELTGKPVRIGISWRVDSAEPGTVFVSRVVTDSAADQAGLKVRDRIYAVAGRPVSDSGELYTLLRTLPSPLDLLIERNGQIMDVSLDLLPARAELPPAE